MSPLEVIGAGTHVFREKGKNGTQVYEWSNVRITKEWSLAAVEYVFFFAFVITRPLGFAV